MRRRHGNLIVQATRKPVPGFGDLYIHRVAIFAVIATDTFTQYHRAVWSMTHYDVPGGWVEQIYLAMKAGEPAGMILDFCRDHGFAG